VQQHDLKTNTGHAWSGDRFCVRLLQYTFVICRRRDESDRRPELQSKNFANNKVGTSSTRKMVVYLPAGYDNTSKHYYPVIYFSLRRSKAIDLCSTMTALKDSSIERSLLE